MINTVKSTYNVNYYCQHPDFLSKSTTRISEIQRKFMNLLDSRNIEYEVEFPVESKCYDIHIKNTNILIEINPSYTHSNYQNHWGKGLSKSYHLEKTLIAERNGYRCIHVWDWDNWENILDLFHTEHSIYARNCNIEFEVDIQEFIDKNSLYPIKLNDHHSTCLVYNGQIIALMLFNSVEENVYELEFITKCGYKVLGGLSKLWKHSIEKFGLMNIIFHCDRSKFTGQSIQTILGLEWVKSTNSRCQWSRDNLVQFNLDLDEYNSKQLLEMKWLPVYDCGEIILSNCPMMLPEESTDTIDYTELMNNIESRKQIKYCEFCGKPFHPESWCQKYCKNEHVRICPVCNKTYIETNNENLKKPPIACSYPCRLKKARQTNLDKYGSKDYFSSNIAKEVARKSMIERYGVPYALMSKEIRDKASNSIYNKYGKVSQNGKIQLSKSDIHNIYYEDDKYIVFKSQDSYMLENVQLCDFIYTINKIPVVVYLDEDPEKVIGQLDLSSNKTIDAESLTVYKLTHEATYEFIHENDYKIDLDSMVLSLGLAEDQTLYQVMIFTRNKHNKDYKLQLSRICNKKGHTILGGLDKQSTIASTQLGVNSCIAYQDQSKPFMNKRFESIGMHFLKQNHGKKIIKGGQTIYDCGTNVYVFG